MSNLYDTYRVPLGSAINTLIAYFTVAREPWLPWKHQIFFKIAIIS